MANNGLLHLIGRTSLRSVIMNILACLPDRLYLEFQWKRFMDYPLNLKNPKSFNEKMAWLKLFDRNPLYTKLADKWLVKDYVALYCGVQYVVKNFGVWDDFDSIDFDKLPSQFVLKCTHASGGIAICKDKSKFNKQHAKYKLTKCLKTNFYPQYREWVYKDIKPRIIAEEFIGDDLQDYRIYCFNGVPKIIYSYTNKSNTIGTKPEPEYCDIFDTEWNPLPFRQNSPPRGDVPRPEHLDEILACSQKLSVGIPFVRVDFYDNGKVLFSECTFYPGAGGSRFHPQEWDFTLGSWIKLSE